MRLRSGHGSIFQECFIPIVSCMKILSLVYGSMTNLTEELRKLESRIMASTKRVNTRSIDYFVASEKLEDLQMKIGEYQDEDRRMIIQINGLPYIHPSNLYRVVESLSGALNVPVQDEDITLLQAMTKYTGEVYQRTGRKVYPIIMGMKTRKLKWSWLHGLRKYLLKSKDQYKKNGLVIEIQMNGKIHTFNGVTLHEHLSPQKRVLFKAVKRRCTEMDYHDLWFNDSQIFVKKRGYDPAQRIRNLQDMYRKITKSHWSRDNLLFRHVQNPHNYDHDNIDI